MEKIAIIAPSSLTYMPYLAYYENILQSLGIPYDLFYWDRFHIDTEKGRGHSFSSKFSTNGLGLVRGYIGFRRFLLKQLNKKAYSFHIVLTMQMGILVQQYLKGKKYLLDIRDFSHENNPIYKVLANSIVNAAGAVVISSDGFRQWLPKDREYIFSHNVSFITNHNSNALPRFNRSNLVISYIGAVGYYDANIRILNAVAHFPRLKLRYIGSGTCEDGLQAYCVKEGIINVEFLGRYTPSQKAIFYEETDFVLACYGQKSLVERTLTPNRLYESCLFGRPIIVNTGTHLSEVVQQHDLGIVVDLDDIGDLYAKLVFYADQQKYQHYLTNCAHFVKKVGDEVILFQTSIGALIKNNIQ